MKTQLSYLINFLIPMLILSSCQIKLPEDKKEIDKAKWLDSAPPELLEKSASTFSVEYLRCRIRVQPEIHYYYRIQFLATRTDDKANDSDSSVIVRSQFPAQLFIQKVEINKDSVSQTTLMNLLIELDITSVKKSPLTFHHDITALATAETFKEGKDRALYEESFPHLKEGAPLLHFARKGSTSATNLTTMDLPGLKENDILECVQ